MQKYLLLFFFVLASILRAQNFKSFERVLHSIDKDEIRGFLKIVNSDSEGIFGMGHVGRSNKDTTINQNVLFIKYDYSGNLIRSNFIVDSNINFFPFLNQRMFPKNDSIYYGLFFVNDKGLYGCELMEINIKNLNIVQKHKFYDYRDIKDPAVFTDTYHSNDSIICFILKDRSKIDGNGYLYIFNKDIKLLKKILIKYNSTYISFRWVSLNSDNTIDVIVQQKIYKKDTFTGLAHLVYNKIDTNGNILKSQRLPINENIYLTTGESFTITRDSNNNFIIGGLDSKPQKELLLHRPYIIKASPEFNSIIWKTSLSEFSEFVEDPIYGINFIINLNKAKGYLLCGSLLTPVKNKVDYGIIYKVSDTGDSIWTRKYQPIGWDSLRWSSIIFYQMSITNNKSIAVASSIGDRTTGYWHPWILNLDSDGCLIPGCGEYVNTENIKNGEQDAFKIYPNPVQDKLFLLSRISSDNVRMQLINLQGELILHNKFQVIEGGQYIIDIPESLPSMVYIFQIMDEQGKIWLNEKVSIVK